MSNILARLLSVFSACLQTLAMAGLCLLPMPAQAAGPDADEMSEVYERFASLERGVENLDMLEARLDRGQTDPLARARSLENDPDAIIKDVSRSISYLPYAGSLRAADGTLASRSGNAIDQAVLLATMLNRAGVEARIVRGEINVEDATTLISSTSRPAPNRPAFSHNDMNAMREGLSGDVPDLMEQTGGSLSEDERQSLTKALDEQVTGLVNALGDTAPPEQAGLPEWMMKTVQQYWWVQYRTEPGSAWVNAHPAWPGGKAPPSLEEVEDAYTGALPGEAVQRVTIRLEMDIQQGSKIKTLNLAELKDIPGSELARNPVTLAILPDTLAANPQADITAAMEQANFIMVGVNGQSAHDPFTLSGIVVPPEALGAEAHGAASFFSSISDKGESAIGALSGDRDNDALAIRNLRLNFISEAPGLPARHDTRILYDATASDGTVPRRKPGEIAAGMTGTYLIGARTGRVTDTGLTSAMIDQAHALAYLIEYDLFRKMIRPDRMPPLSEVVSDLDPSLPLTLLAYAETRIPQTDGLAALSGPLARLGLNAGTIGLKEPSVLMPARPLVRMTGTESMMNAEAGDAPKYALRHVADLVSSPVIAVSSGASGINPRDGLRAGLWMSRLEGDITRAGADTRVYDTEGILELAHKQDIPLVTLSASNDEESEDPAPPGGLEELELPHKSIAAIQRDLDAGFAVLVPQRLPDDVPYGAWWRVHPETGEALAMLDIGRGAEYQEYLNILNATLSELSFFMIANDTTQCLNKSNMQGGSRLACCLVTSAIPITSAGASVAGTIKAGHPAVMFALAFISINTAIMGGIVGNELNLKSMCYE